MHLAQAQNAVVSTSKYSAKITDMFAGGAAVASMSSVTAMIQQQQVEGEDSSSGQERSSRDAAD